MTEARTAALEAIERWVAWVRIGGVAFAALEIGVFTSRFPPGYEAAGWALTGVLAAGAAAFLWLAYHEPPGRVHVVSLAALVFDAAVIGAFATIFSYEYGNQTRWALILVVAEAALRYGLLGGVAMPIVLIPYFAFNEWWRAHKFGPPGFLSDRVSFPAGVTLLMGLIVGWLVRRLEHEAYVSSERAGEAERLRDALGRRVDVLEAENRCARALG
jgi:hypothetical protein